MMPRFLLRVSDVQVSNQNFTPNVVAFASMHPNFTPNVVASQWQAAAPISACWVEMRVWVETTFWVEMMVITFFFILVEVTTS
jgi:hypothetical protein